MAVHNQRVFFDIGHDVFQTMMFFPVGDEVGVQVLGRKLFSSSFLPTQSSLEIALKKIQPTPPPETPPSPPSPVLGFLQPQRPHSLYHHGHCSGLTQGRCLSFPSGGGYGGFSPGCVRGVWPGSRKAGLPQAECGTHKTGESPISMFMKQKGGDCVLSPAEGSCFFAQ